MLLSIDAMTMGEGNLTLLAIMLSCMLSEATLIRLAYAFEQGTHQRKAPTFVPTLDSDNLRESAGTSDAVRERRSRRNETPVG
jgi:hypothetical protein